MSHMIELPDTLNVYVKAINENFVMDLSKVPQERIQRALVFGWQTMFGNARNGAGQGNGSNVALITPHIQKKVEQQYLAIEAGTTGQRASDPYAKAIKKLANEYATAQGLTRKANAAAFETAIAEFVADPLACTIDQLAGQYAAVWARENGKQATSPETLAQRAVYAAKPKLIAKAQAKLPSTELESLED